MLVTGMSNKKQQIPDIRFKGFTDDWEQRKLGEVSEITKLAGFEFTKYIKYSDTGHIPAIRGLNVKNGNFVFNDVKYIDESDFSKLSRSKLFAGDIVFTYVGTIGEAAIIPENVTWYLAPNVSRIRTTELNPTFLLQLLINPVFRRKEIETWIATSSQPALSMENIRKFEMNIPSHKEQTKIGKFFNNLDKTITLHQRQLYYYKELKKATLQKMFPREGEKVPEVRFDGYTGEWELRKLGELAFFSKGTGYTKGDLTTAGKPIILYGRLYTKYETIIENVDTFVVEKEKSVISAGNEVIVPASGETSEDISRASVVAKPGIILGGDLNIIKPKTEIDPAFLALTISNGGQQKELSKKAQGKSVVHLHNSDLKEVDLVYPQKEEQSKIGTFFKHLDDTINLHQQKVKDYQKLKEVVLKQVFV